MANIVQIRLLENKTAQALWGGRPIEYEGGYKIIAGEVNATQFELTSVPKDYELDEFTIRGYNAGKQEVTNIPTVNKGEIFTLPVGMAVAGYSSLLIECIHGEEKVKWLPIKLKVYNTNPDWVTNSISPTQDMLNRLTEAEEIANKAQTTADNAARSAQAASNKANSAVQSGTGENGVEVEKTGTELTIKGITATTNQIGVAYLAKEVDCGSYTDDKSGTTPKAVKKAIVTDTNALDDIFNATSTHRGTMSKEDKAKLDAFGAANTYATKTELKAVTDKIPTQATSSNQLADKAFVNSSINNVAAYYITKNATGDAFATKAELTAATTFYSGGAMRTPTRNDYAIVIADESKKDTVTGVSPTTRYSYNNGWEFQYVVNNSPFTAAQWSALNSGATTTLIAQITTNKTDIASIKTKNTTQDTNISDLQTRMTAVESKNTSQDTAINKAQSAAEAAQTAANGKYTKPSTGIPKTDLASAVQTSLNKADSAVQPEALADVATSGSYDDLIDKPEIPTIPSSLPPSGAAGGDLTGTYPNPTIKNNAITKTKLDSSLQSAIDKINETDLSNYVTKNEVEDISGEKTFLSPLCVANKISGSLSSFVIINTNSITRGDSGIVSNNYTINFPSKSGTLALTDDISQLANAIPATEKGTKGGVATLDDTGHIPNTQLPSYVDDVLEYDTFESLPKKGESGKIYLVIDTNLSYRWSGSQYVEISSSLALGETDQTAYPGNKGKENADKIAELDRTTVRLVGGKIPSIMLPEATSNTLGMVQLGSDEVQRQAMNAPSSVANRTYPIQKNASGKMVVNVPWELENPLYDLVVTTQSEFESFYKSLDNKTCTAKSVLFVGDGGELVFERKDGKGLQFPSTLKRISGINNATIKVSKLTTDTAIDAFGYDITTNRDVIDLVTAYDTGDYCISHINLIVEVVKGAAIAFDLFPQMYDCHAEITGSLTGQGSIGTTGFQFCNYATDCSVKANVTGVLTSGSLNADFQGFVNCSYLTNVKVNGELVGTRNSNYYAPDANISGYLTCNYVTNADSDINLRSQGNGTTHGFDDCRNLVNCTNKITSNVSGNNYEMICGFAHCFPINNCNNTIESVTKQFANLGESYGYSVCEYGSNCKDKSLEGNLTAITKDCTKMDADTCDGVGTSGDVAGGDLTGTFPNPKIKNGAVGMQQLSEGVQFAVNKADTSVQRSGDTMIGDLSFATGRGIKGVDERLKYNSKDLAFLSDLSDSGGGGSTLKKTTATITGSDSPYAVQVLDDDVKTTSYIKVYPASEADATILESASTKYVTSFAGGFGFTVTNKGSGTVTIVYEIQEVQA